MGDLNLNFWWWLLSVFICGAVVSIIVQVGTGNELAGHVSAGIVGAVMGFFRGIQQFR